MFELLTIRSGKEIDWYTVVFLSNTILIENGEERPMPSWITPSILERMDELRARAWPWLISPKDVRLANEIRELLTAVFLDELKTKLENFVNGSEIKKLNLYETVSWRQNLMSHKL